MSTTIEIKIPDIGDVDEVEVIEVLVAENDHIDAEQSLITVESDKASMEIPASHAGTVKSMSVKVGDKVSEGTVILLLEEQADGASDQASADDSKSSSDDAAAQQKSDAGSDASQNDDAPAPDQDTAKAAAPSSEQKSTSVVQAGKEHELASAPPARQSPTASFAATDVAAQNLPHASPSVRKFARELGVDLYQVEGSGARQRITHDDVRQFVKQALSSDTGTRSGTSGTGVGLDILGWPKVDFTR